MQIKLATFFVLAVGLAACASDPPPPPPVAAAPDPAPAPAPAPVASGPATYRGTVEAAADNGRRCRKIGSSASARVNNGGFALGGLRGKVGSDGAVTSTGRGGSMTGTLANGTLDVTETKGKCSYHYTLNQA